VEARHRSRPQKLTPLFEEAQKSRGVLMTPWPMTPGPSPASLRAKRHTATVRVVETTRRPRSLRALSAKYFRLITGFERH